jgi:hypothetical protein
MATSTNKYFFFRWTKTISEKYPQTLQIPDDGRSCRNLCPDTGMDSLSLDWNLIISLPAMAASRNSKLLTS